MLYVSDVIHCHKQPPMDSVICCYLYSFVSSNYSSLVTHFCHILSRVTSFQHFQLQSAKSCTLFLAEVLVALEITQAFSSLITHSFVISMHTQMVCSVTFIWTISAAVNYSWNHSTVVWCGSLLLIIQYDSLSSPQLWSCQSKSCRLSIKTENIIFANSSL